MASDLFKRVESRKSLFAVEKTILIYNLLTSILILFMFQRMDYPLHMLWDRAVIAAMTFSLVYLYQLTPCKLSAFVCIATQTSFLSYWYPGASEFGHIFPNLNCLFATAERWTFGGQPAVWFCRALPQVRVSEPFGMGYFAYHPIVLMVTLFYFTYRLDLFGKMSFVLVIYFFTYYLIYMFVPVAGPQFRFPTIDMGPVSQGVFPAIGDYLNHNQESLPDPGYQHGFFYDLVEDSQQVGERPTAAFSDSHIGVPTILVVIAWRSNKKLFACLLPFYLLLYGTTVYTQAYYLVDAIAGFIPVFVLYVLVTKMFKKWFVVSVFK